VLKVVLYKREQALKKNVTTYSMTYDSILKTTSAAVDRQRRNLLWLLVTIYDEEGIASTGTSQPATDSSRIAQKRVART